MCHCRLLTAPSDRKKEERFLKGDQLFGLCLILLFFLFYSTGLGISVFPEHTICNFVPWRLQKNLTQQYFPYAPFQLSTASFKTSERLTICNCFLARGRKNIRMMFLFGYLDHPQTFHQELKPRGQTHYKAMSI